MVGQVGSARKQYWKGLNWGGGGLARGIGEGEGAGENDSQALHPGLGKLEIE